MTKACLTLSALFVALFLTFGCSTLITEPVTKKGVEVYQNPRNIICNNRLIPKEDAQIPDVSLLIVKYRTYTTNNKGLVFYSDKIGGRVVAVASYASKVGSISALSWEVGGVIRTMYPNKYEMVCERKILYHKGLRYDLEYMFQIYFKKTKKVV